MKQLRILRNRDDMTCSGYKMFYVLALWIISIVLYYIVTGGGG